MSSPDVDGGGENALFELVDADDDDDDEGDDDLDDLEDALALYLWFVRVGRWGADDTRQPCGRDLHQLADRATQPSQPRF